MVFVEDKMKFLNIRFLDNFIFPTANTQWPENKKIITAKVRNSKNLCIASLGWVLGEIFNDLHSIRISGKWTNEASATAPTKDFEKVVYYLNSRNRSMLKSNTSDLNEEASKDDTINVFTESDEIVIKGADLGANIKVCNTSVVVMKSIVSNTDVVRIKLPEKQNYVVHIGNSQYKIAL